MEEEKERALEDPLGIAFVTFESEKMAKDVFDAFSKSIFTCWEAQPWKALEGVEGKSSKTSKNLGQKLNAGNWDVSYAPMPDDIYWQNLGSKRSWLFLIKYIFSRVLLFLIIFFLSTPGMHSA